MDNANYLFGMQQWNILSLSITCEVSGNVHLSLVWLRKTNAAKVLFSCGCQAFIKYTYIWELVCQLINQNSLNEQNITSGLPIVNTKLQIDI